MPRVDEGRDEPMSGQHSKSEREHQGHIDPQIGKPKVDVIPVGTG